MKNVELIRARIVRGMQGELVRIRSFLSSLDGNQEEVELLRGEQGTAILAVIADTVMRELGHTTELEPEDGHSKTARAVGTPRRRAG